MIGSTVGVPEYNTILQCRIASHHGTAYSIKLLTVRISSTHILHGSHRQNQIMTINNCHMNTN